MYLEICSYFFLMFRSVLSRAELEALPLDNNLKQDVEKGKVKIFYMLVLLPTFCNIIEIFSKQLHFYMYIPNRRMFNLYFNLSAKNAFYRLIYDTEYFATI